MTKKADKTSATETEQKLVRTVQYGAPVTIATVGLLCILHDLQSSLAPLAPPAPPLQDIPTLQHPLRQRPENFRFCNKKIWKFVCPYFLINVKEKMYLSH